MQFWFVLTVNFSFTSVLFHHSSGKKAHVLSSYHMTIQLQRGTGKSLFKKNRCIWGRTWEINWEPVLLKVDLCQEGDRHIVWSSTVLISTELLCLWFFPYTNAVRITVPLPLSPPLLCLWPNSPTMHHLSPWSFEGYPCSCGELCLWLDVPNCVNFDATGLVAMKAQQHWLCHNLYCL